MKAIVRSLLIVGCSLFLFGCPYSSSVPISEPEANADKKLDGRWLGDDNSIYIVKAKGMLYDVAVRSADSNSSADDRYEGYFTTVKGVAFLNLYEVTTNAREYMVFKAEFPEKGTIVLREMSEDIKESFKTSIQLRQYIEKNMYRDDFHKPGRGPLTLEKL